MVGEDRVNDVVAYLSRLMGESPSLEAPLQLRSVHRAALASWARKQNVPVRLSVLSSSAPFSVRDLLSEGELSTTTSPAIQAAVAPPAVASTAALGGALLGIGIDIEEVENLPATQDYREHPFFQDNFTPGEIAYCIRQNDARASLCGTWAAKEAILKSGIVHVPSGTLKTIEIAHDDAGRPLFPGCQISISHTARTAVAVCVAFAAAPARPMVVQQVPSPVLPPDVLPIPIPGKRWPWSRN